MEDYFTSTVDGDAGFAKMNAEKLSKYPNDYSDDERIDSEENNYDDDRYNCSDPGCPCGGNKRGGV